MSSSAAAAADAVEVPKKGGGKKKLIMILAAVLLVVGAGGGAAVVFMKKRAAAAAEAAEADGEDAPAAADKHAAKDDHKTPPAFVPLDMFTVNLADREAERYAQIGVTLELTDAKAADKIKAYMPAIRSNILMVLSQKTSADLLAREGKTQLAAEILREAVKPLGYEIELPEAAASGADAPAKKKKKKAAPEDEAPVRNVHFSNFIIQ